MMNLYKHITLAAGLASLLALHACSAGDDGLPEIPTPNPPAEERVPLRIASAAIGNGIGVQTRANPALTAGSIGLFQKEDATNNYEAIDNQQFTYAAPFWQTDNQILLGSSPAVIAAYYPYAAGRANPLLLNSHKYSDEAGNLCYVNLTASKNDSHLTLNLERVYTRLVFTLKGSGYPGDGKVSAMRLSGVGIVSVATLDLLNQSVFADAANYGVYNVRQPLLDFEEVEIKAETQFTNTADGKIDLLLVPTKLTDDITFTLTVDGITLSGKVSATALCGKADGILREGVQYDVTLTVKPVKLEVASISIMEWETEDLGEGEVN